MTHTGLTLRRRLAVSAMAALVAASLTLAVSAPITAAQDAGPYPDTPAGAFYTPAVEALHNNGVFDGTLCTDGFCPDRPLDRATMAVWTVRVLDGQDPPAVTSTRFADVDATGFHASFIERFATLGVTEGCGDGTGFCPDDPVQRWQMAVFLSRAFGLADGPDPNFGDIAADAWYASSVAKLAASGITAGCGDGTNFCPDKPTTRAEMAIFLARAVGLVARPSAPAGAAPAEFTSISAGNAHACAVRADKTVACWGSNDEGQSDVPPGEYLAVSAGGFHTCAIRVDKTLVCWGFNRDGQLDAPRGEFESVSAGSFHSCAVTGLDNNDLSALCWGHNGSGRTVPAIAVYSAVSAGLEHSCGLHTGNVLQCWGGNSHLQGGVPDQTSVTCNFPAGCRPDLHPIPGEFIAVSAGAYHSCGVHTSNRVICWGDNTEGQVDQPPGEFLSVSAGFQHTCGVRTDNTAHCWGRDLAGETAAPGGSFVTVSAGSSFSCGLRTDGQVECWGHDGEGQSSPPGSAGSGSGSGSSGTGSSGTGSSGTGSSGTGSSGTGSSGSGSSGPAGATSAIGFIAVSAGDGHACAIRDDKTLACWGKDDKRQSRPRSGEFLAVSAGGSHACGLRVDNTLGCWGDREFEQSSPPSGDFLAVSAGFDHSCAVDTNTVVHCWGFDGHGQTGVPSGTYSAVSAGHNHSCGVRSSGSIQCWGDNSLGQGGVEDPRGAMTCSTFGCRRDLAPITGPFVSVSAGGSHTCGLRTNHIVECWGDDTDGQSSPPSGQFLSVSAGFKHTCGVLIGNTVECWGRDIAGETAAPGGLFVTVSAGSSFTCGVRFDSRVECWGHNGDGRATPPTE